MRQDSYESILRAVGRVLDQSDTRTFSLRTTDDGLVVEATKADGAPDLSFDLTVADLAHLSDWAANEAPRYERASASDEGTLRAFLERRQRVPAGVR